MNYVLETFSNINTNFSSTKITSIIVNICIFVIILSICVFLLFFIKKQTKGTRLILTFYLLFWIPIFLGRDYRSKMNDAVYNQLSIEANMQIVDYSITLIIMMGYGFVGIFARIFADWFTYLTKYRKSFLYFAIIINIATFIPIVISPNQYTNIVQVIGVGLSASCIGTVELLFRNNYDNNKSFLTVSILSIPPLLANFITAPIQSIVSTLATYTGEINNKKGNFLDPNILKWLWIIGLIILVICLIMLFFIKEKKLYFKPGLKINNFRFRMFVYKTSLNQNKNKIFYFLIVSIIGFIVMFIKFSNSGAIGLNHLKVLSNNTSSSYEGYLSVVFSLAQLVAGVIVGVVLIKRWKVIYIFLLGCMSWIIYLIATIFIKNQYAYFVIHSLNGFAYGILYNLLLALILSISLNTTKITSMGIYQSILSIGIMCSGSFNTFLKEILPTIKKTNANVFDFDVYYKNNAIVNGVLIILVLVIFIMFLSLNFYLKKNDNNFYLNQLEAKNKINVKK